MADTPWFPRRNKNTKTATNPTTPQTVTEHVKLMFQPCKSNTSEKKHEKTQHVSSFFLRQLPAERFFGSVTVQHLVDPSHRPEAAEAVLGGLAWRVQRFVQNSFVMELAKPSVLGVKSEKYVPFPPP